MKFLEKIFSIKNEKRKKHKIVTIFGIRFAVKSKYLQLRRENEETRWMMFALEQKVWGLISDLEGVLKFNTHMEDSKKRDDMTLEEHKKNVDDLLKNLSFDACQNAKKILERLDKL